MSKFNFKEIYKQVSPENESKFFECLMQEIWDNIDLKGYECPICENKIPLFLPSKSRDKFYCPKCESYDRHRFIYYYFKNHTDIFSEKTKFLHFAPERAIYDILINQESIDYLTADLNDGPLIKETMDMCQIPYPDNYFDVIYNCHVLEHIPDDIKAMVELYRCVKPASEGGVVFVMVPLFRHLSKTFEDEKFDTPELRLKHFGQEDHVRMYGLDIKSRLESVGFQVFELICKDYFDSQIIDKYGLYPGETLFICIKQ